MNYGVVLVILLTARVSAADPDPRALEESGAKHYELAEYAAAIADFKEAFRLNDRPALLFNIAQAYRLGGDCEQARTFYKNYLRRMPDAPNAELVQRRIAEPCATKPPPPPPVTVLPPAPPPAPSRPTWRRPTGIGLIIAGALAGGLGVAWALHGRSIESDLGGACADGCEGLEAMRLDALGRDANRNAVIGGAAGAVLVTAGVFVWQWTF